MKRRSSARDGWGKTDHRAQASRRVDELAAVLVRVDGGAASDPLFEISRPSLRPDRCVSCGAAA